MSMSVYSNIVKQINAKLKMDLYRLVLPPTFSKTMVVGVNVVNEGRKSIISLCASIN